MSNYNTIEVSDTNPRVFTLLDKSGNPITSGTVSYYAICLVGSEAGSFWSVSDQDWTGAIDDATNTMTHVADGHWKIDPRTTALGPFVDGFSVLEYVMEGGALHIPTKNCLKVEHTPLASAGRGVRIDTNHATTLTTNDFAGIIATVNSHLGSPAGASIAADIAALLAAIQNVQNGTFISTTIPPMLERPDSGSTSISISVVIFDETGSPKNLDSGNPTATLVNDAGTDRSSRLGSWSNPSTGKYVIAYTNTSSDAVEGLHWDITATVNTKARRYVAFTQIVDTTAVDFTSTDRTNLGSILTKVTPIPASPAAVGSPMTLADGAITSDKFDQATAFPISSDVFSKLERLRVFADGSISDLLSLIPTPVDTSWFTAATKTIYVTCPDGGEDGADGTINAGYATTQEAIDEINAGRLANNSAYDTPLIEHQGPDDLVNGYIEFPNHIVIEFDGGPRNGGTSEFISTGNTDPNRAIVNFKDYTIARNGFRVRSTTLNHIRFPLGYAGPQAASKHVLVDMPDTVNMSDGLYFNSSGPTDGHWQLNRGHSPSNWDSHATPDESATHVTQLLEYAFSAVGPPVGSSGDVRPLTNIGGLVVARNCTSDASGTPSGGINPQTGNPFHIYAAKTRGNGVMVLIGGRYRSNQYCFGTEDASVIYLIGVDYASTDPDNFEAIEPGSNVVDLTRLAGLTPYDLAILNAVATDAAAMAPVVALNLDAKVSEAGGGGGTSGPGADQITITITDGAGPIPDAGVWITSDSGGATTVAGTLTTNSDGEVVFLLDDGLTYYLSMQKDGWNPIKAQSFVADKDAGNSFTTTAADDASPDNDLERTFICRRVAGRVGSTKIIPKAAGESPTMWFDVSRLLEDGESIATVTSITASGMTSGGIDHAGSLIEFYLTGGTVTDDPVDAICRFTTSAGRPIECRGYVLVV